MLQSPQPLPPELVLDQPDQRDCRGQRPLRPGAGRLSRHPGHACPSPARISGGAPTAAHAPGAHHPRGPAPAAGPPACAQPDGRDPPGRPALLTAGVHRFPGAYHGAGAFPERYRRPGAPHGGLDRRFAVGSALHAGLRRPARFHPGFLWQQLLRAGIPDQRGVRAAAGGRAGFPAQDLHPRPPVRLAV